MGEVASKVVDVHLNDFVFDSGLHCYFVMLVDSGPVIKVGEETSTKHISDDVASTVLICIENLRLFRLVELLSCSYCNIHVFIHSMMHQLVLSLLAVLSQLVEDVPHEVLLVLETELDGSHICLHQMAVVEDVILPAFQEDVQCSLSSSLFLPQNPSHLIKYLREEDLLSIIDLEHTDSNSMPKELTVVLPIVYCLPQIFIIPSFNQFFEFSN